VEHHRNQLNFSTSKKVVLLECLTGISDAETSSQVGAFQLEPKRTDSDPLQIMGISEVVGCAVGLAYGHCEM